MNTLISILFHSWCGPYDPKNIPECLQGNPTTAYAMYAFEKGLKLGMELAVTCLNPGDLAEEV